MSAAEVFARGESNRTEQIVDGSETPRRPAGELDGSPAQQGGGGQFGQPLGCSPLPPVLAAPPAVREGSAHSPVRRPLRPHRYTTKFCTTGCNARGRVHQDGVCIVCKTFGSDR